jgi:hypothetical protein
MSTVTEKMPVHCPQCGKKLMVPTSAAGKQGRCPSCTHVFMIDAPLAASLVDPLPDLTPLDDNNPFGNNAFGGAADYSLQSLAPAPAPAYQQTWQDPAGGVQAAPNPYPAVVNPYGPPPADEGKYNHGFGLEQRGWDAGMMGGLLMMVIGAVWFFGGLAFGLIFWYAPILFVIGLVGFIRGMFTGNIAGN